MLHSGYHFCCISLFRLHKDCWYAAEVKPLEFFFIIGQPLCAGYYDKPGESLAHCGPSLAGDYFWGRVLLVESEDFAHGFLFRQEGEDFRGVAVERNVEDREAVSAAIAMYEVCGGGCRF